MNASIASRALLTGGSPARAPSPPGPDGPEGSNGPPPPWAGGAGGGCAGPGPSGPSSRAGSRTGSRTVVAAGGVISSARPRPQQDEAHGEHRQHKKNAEQDQPEASVRGILIVMDVRGHGGSGDRYTVEGEEAEERGKVDQRGEEHPLRALG